MARGFDIYSNPLLTDSSLATTFVLKLRDANIQQMDKLIEGECNQYKGYVHLSIQNWDLARYKGKSLDEAEEYSRQLTMQIPYQQAQQYTFPFGVRTYIESEEILKKAVLNRTEPLKEKELVDDMYYTCIQMNNQKYFIVLSSNRYNTNNQSAFISESELLQSASGKSLLKLDHVPSEQDKLTPPNMGKKLGFTEKDFLVANSLIDDDVKTNFSESSVHWIDYKKASRDMQSSFNKFMKDGGRNKQFAVLASAVKYYSLKTDNFKNVEIRNEQTLRGLSKIDSTDTSKEQLKNLMKQFNYQSF